MSIREIPLQTTAPAIPPAPSGEDLDKLVDECAHWIETTVGTFKKRLSPDLRPDNDGRSSMALTDGKNQWGSSVGHGGIRGWIVDGTLRDIAQLREIVNDFLDAMKQRVRIKRHLDPNWTIDNNAMAVLSSRFGIPDAPRTFDELAARQAEQRVIEERQRVERDAEFRRKQAEWQLSPEGREFERRLLVDEFKREQVNIVMNALFPFERIEYADPDNPTDAEKVANKTKRFDNYLVECNRLKWEPRIREIVNKTDIAAHEVVRAFQTAEFEASHFADVAEREWTGDDDFDVLRFEENFIMETLKQVATASLTGNPAPLTKSCVPPVIDGVERVSGAKFADICEAMERFDREGYVLDIRRDFDGLVLTAVPPALRDAWEKYSREWDEQIQEIA